MAAQKIKHIILGVHITDRLKEAVEVQRLLTAFGASIKTRLGLHEVQDKATGPNGLLILEMIGGDKPAKDLTKKLNALDGVEVKAFTFEHPAP
jgi:hypothetical protein